MIYISSKEGQYDTGILCIETCSSDNDSLCFVWNDLDAQCQWYFVVSGSILKQTNNFYTCNSMFKGLQ